MDNDTYILIFLGNDGDFSYTQGEYPHVEDAFTVPRVQGIEWRFDGQTWISRETILVHRSSSTPIPGTWTVTRASWVHHSLRV